LRTRGKLRAVRIRQCQAEYHLFPGDFQCLSSLCQRQPRRQDIVDKNHFFFRKMLQVKMPRMCQSELKIPARIPVTGTVAQHTVTRGEPGLFHCTCQQGGMGVTVPGVIVDADHGNVPGEFERLRMRGKGDLCQKRIEMIPKVRMFGQQQRFDLVVFVKRVYRKFSGNFPGVKRGGELIAPAGPANVRP